MLTTEWGNVRYPSCRDKGRLWGRVGCLSWGQRDPVGTAWSNQVAPQRGQAQGPLIHSTPPLVPTGRGTHISRFDRQTSSGRWGCKRSDGAIPRFDCQTSLGTRGGCGATRSSGDCVEQPGRTPTRTSTRPPHPLHPAPCPYRTRDAHFPIRSSNIIRTLGMQAFRWCNSPIRLSNIIRDKGRMWGNAIQWGLRGATRSHPNEDKHQASSSTPPRPLSLQDTGRRHLNGYDYSI